MKQKISPILKALPILYLVFIILLLFYHFSMIEEMSRVIENISYKGTKTVETGLSPASIQKLSVFTNGLKINFSKRNKLKLITVDGIVRELQVQDLVQNETGITLNFKYDISLEFSSRNSDSSILVNVPRTRPPVREIVVSADASENFQISQDDQGRIILSDGTSSFFLDSNTDIEYREGALTISLLDSVSSRISLKDEAPGLGRTAIEWLANTDKTVPEKYDSITQFRDKAYKGWTQRFDKSTGALKMPDGPPAFSEKALVYYLSEIYSRNEETLYASDLLKAAERQSSQLSWYSSPYTGDIVNRTAALVRTAPSALLKDMSSLETGQNIEITPYREIRALQELLADSSVTDPVPWIEENIYPLIVWLDEGLYLFHPDNPEADTLYSLVAAELLDEAADKTGATDLLDLSNALRHSLLSRAAEDGTLPGSITFSREHPSKETGSLPAERVYALYQPEKFSPYVVELDNELSNGAWLFTVAENSTVRKLSQSVEIDLDFPVGQIHHLVIKGVEPFDRIFLHGIRWKSDPRFQRYSDGWAYNSVSKTLYVKLKHRNRKETIQILYSPPAPPAAPAAAVPAEAPVSENTPSQAGAAGAESTTP